MENQTQSLKRVLGFRDLMGIGVGQIIGAGIMSMTGVAIAMTGKSVPIAFIIAGIMTTIAAIPQVMINSTIRLNGGTYTIIALLVDRRLGGMYTIIGTISQLSIAVYALSFADYLMSLIGMGNRTIIAFLVLTLFYVLNMAGIDKMSKVQNVIVVFLVVALALFTIFGLAKVDYAHYLDKDFMTAGLMGLFTASSLLTFATSGATTVTNLSGESKNPTRDIPLVIIASTLVVAVLYGFMGIVAAGILPLSETAGQPLSATAKEILPAPLYVFFIVGGALCALGSTLNSQLASVTKPMLRATWDGWFPQKWGKLSRYQTPSVYLTVLYAIGLITIFTGVDIGVIGSLVVLLTQLTGLFMIYAMYRLPKVLPEEWAGSRFHVSNAVLYLLVVISLPMCAFNIWLNCRGKGGLIILGNLIMLIVSFGYSIWRYKSGKVVQNTSYEKV